MKTFHFAQLPQSPLLAVKWDATYQSLNKANKILTFTWLKFESATGTNPYSLLLSTPFPLTPIPPTVLSARGISVNLAF